MDEKTEKYLAQLLEGCEKNIGPLKAAINQMEGQLEDMVAQRDAMEEAMDDLKNLLGLDGEAELLEDNAEA